MPNFAADRCACALALIGALAGCGHSGSSFGLGPAPENPPGYSDREMAARQLASRLVLLDETREAAMPTGSATYTGLAGMLYDTGEDDTFVYEDAAIADLRLRANFGTSRVSGSMTNWESMSVGPISGRLDIQDGAIDGSGLSALAAGQLSGAGRTADVALEMEGVFLGDSANAVAGYLNGTATFHDGFEGAAEGIFGAERR